jgi:hypothetical protein
MGCDGSSSDRLPVCVQVDVDELDVYFRSVGVPCPALPPACSTDGVAFFRDLLAEHDALATFFICGKDLAHAPTREALGRVVAAGHEIANHTMTHPPDFARLPMAEQEAEVDQAERAIEEHLGVRPRGFRAPGFSNPPHLTQILVERGYLYDCSRLPVRSPRLLRACHAIMPGVRQVPSTQYGGGSARLTPRVTGPLVELPVSVVPVLRVPFHGTWVQATHPLLLHAGLWGVRHLGLPLVYVFHAIEAVEAPRGLSAWQYPFLRRRSAARRRTAGLILRTILRHFTPIRTDAWAEQWLQRNEA